MIKINDLHKTFEQKGKKVEVLKGITKHIKKGEKVDKCRGSPNDSDVYVGK